MYHVFCLFVLDNVPALPRQILKGRAESGMILLPLYAFEIWIGIRYGYQLELRWLEVEGLSGRSDELTITVDLTPGKEYCARISSASACFSGYFSHSMYPCHPFIFSGKGASGWLDSLDERSSLSFDPIADL